MVQESVTFLAFTICWRIDFPDGSPSGASTSHPSGLSANANSSWWDSSLFNMSSPLLHRRYPASTLLRDDPTANSGIGWRAACQRSQHQNISGHRQSIAAPSTCIQDPESSHGVRDQDFPPPPLSLPSDHVWKSGVALLGVLTHVGRPYESLLAFGAAVRSLLPLHTSSRISALSR